MCYTDANFEVVNWPDFREGSLTGLCGDLHKYMRSVTDKTAKYEHNTMTCEGSEYAVVYLHVMCTGFMILRKSIHEF
jgi:hypothetical protein